MPLNRETSSKQYTNITLHLRHTMNNILFITAFNPSKEDAGSNYTRQLLSKLGETHKIDLIIFKYKEQKPYNPASDNIKILEMFEISTLSKIVGLASLPTLFPLFTARFSHKALKKINAHMKENAYDVVYFDFSQTFAYSLFIKHSRKLLMAHDIIQQRYERRNKVWAWWVKESERKLLKTADKIFTFSEKDCELIKKLYSLDSDSTSFFIQKEAIMAVPNPTSNYYLFYGNWNRPDNYESLEWFLDHVYNTLDKNLQFKIIGMRLPQVYIDRVAQLENVQYLGFVDDPYQMIADAKALITPLHNGAGVKVKVIEALACGTPVIGTDIAFEGIDKKYQDFMIRANTTSEYKQHIEQLAISIERRREFKEMFVKNYIDKPVLRYLSD